MCNMVNNMVGTERFACGCCLVVGAFLRVLGGAAAAAVAIAAAGGGTRGLDLL